jgi:hypothetical protein
LLLLFIPLSTLPRKKTAIANFDKMLVVVVMIVRLPYCHCSWFVCMYYSGWYGSMMVWYHHFFLLFLLKCPVLDPKHLLFLSYSY